MMYLNVTEKRETQERQGPEIRLTQQMKCEERREDAAGSFEVLT